MAERRAQHEGPEPNPVGDGGDPGEGRERLERRDRRGVRAVPRERVEEVVGDPDRIEPQILGSLGPGRRRRRTRSHRTGARSRSAGGSGRSASGEDSQAVGLVDAQRAAEQDPPARIADHDGARHRSDPRRTSRRPRLRPLDRASGSRPRRAAATRRLTSRTCSGSCAGRRPVSPSTRTNARSSPDGDRRTSASPRPSCKRGESSVDDLDDGLGIESREVREHLPEPVDGLPLLLLSGVAACSSSALGPPRHHRAPAETGEREHRGEHAGRGDAAPPRRRGPPPTRPRSAPPRRHAPRGRPAARPAPRCTPAWRRPAAAPPPPSGRRRTTRDDDRRPARSALGNTPSTCSVSRSRTLRQFTGAPCPRSRAAP